MVDMSVIVATGMTVRIVASEMQKAGKFMKVKSANRSRNQEPRLVPRPDQKALELRVVYYCEQQNANITMSGLATSPIGAELRTASTV